jgi:hypothetical protein
MRVLSVDLSPVGGESEKLTFTLDVVALVKNAS